MGTFYISREFMAAENWFEETLASHRICTYKFGVYVYRSLAERYVAKCYVPTLCGLLGIPRPFLKLEVC